ncbi:hypothetical protein GCK32_017913, partial [Trichostrongylus colubriformis]
ELSAGGDGRGPTLVLAPDSQRSGLVILNYISIHYSHQGPPHSTMPNCPACQKPVYFGERVSSLGKDWHRPCLRCTNESCKKTLTSGGHSEVMRLSTKENHTAIDAMEQCSVRKVMATVELRAIHSMLVPPDNFEIFFLFFSESYD